MHLIAVLSGCLSVFCLSLVLLIFSFQAPLAHSYPPLILQLNADIWDYLLVENAWILINHMRLDAHEERHLLDVKRLVWWLFILTAFMVLIFSSSLYRVKAQWRLLCRHIALLGWSVVGAVLLLVAFSGFRVGFVYFHELLFVPGSWWFAADAGLIQAFPLVYFQQFALFFVLLVSALLLIIYCATCPWRR